LRNRSIVLEMARNQFYWQRELLEARFITYAQAHMDSNLWLWGEAEFGDSVLIACSKKENVVYSYIPVTVEMNRPVRHRTSANELFLRQVTVIAKFTPKTSSWELTDRTFFNQSPHEVIHHRAQELCLVDLLKNRTI